MKKLKFHQSVLPATHRLMLLGALSGLTACAIDTNTLDGEVITTEQALTGSEVLGFENPAHWTVSSGTRSSLSNGTEGSAALGVSNTYYSELTSTPISSVGFVSSDLALDVMLPTAASWGFVQIVLEMPSKAVWYGNLGTQQLAGLTPGVYQTLHFQVPANILSALQDNPNDLKVRVILNAQVTAAPVAFDNLRFVGQPSGPSVVEMRANLVDDVAFLAVNGLRHRIGYWAGPSLGEWVDVTAWFVGGSNDVRLFASNYGGPGGVDVEFRVDGDVVAHVNCSGASCPVGENNTFVNEIVTLPELSLPPARQVTVTSAATGKLYVDDEYTGLTTPATLALPSGTFRLGLGVSNNALVNMTGSFYEESVVVGANDQSVVLGDTAPLEPTNISRIAILPVRRARVVEGNRLATLSDEDVARFASQARATSEQYVEPFSYGLNRWEVTVLPVEEELELIAPNWAEFPDHACGDIVYQPKYANIYDLYDTVVVHMSNTDANNLVIGRSDAGMAGRCGQVQKAWGHHLSPTSPIPVLNHEILHSYEAHHWEIERQWNGVSGLHGAEVHGYLSNGPQGQPEWTEWYRDYMRGQARELTSMQNGDIRPSKPTSQDYFIGVFRTVRYGLWH